MAIHSSTLDWKMPGTEEPGRLQSMGSQRIVQNWTTSLLPELTAMKLLEIRVTFGNKADKIEMPVNRIYPLINFFWKKASTGCLDTCFWALRDKLSILLPGDSRVITAYSSVTDSTCLSLHVLCRIALESFPKSSWHNSLSTKLMDTSYFLGSAWGLNIIKHGNYCVNYQAPY